MNELQMQTLLLWLSQLIEEFSKLLAEARQQLAELRNGGEDDGAFLDGALVGG